MTGENGGNMKVWRPNALLAKTLNLAPNDSIARSASRYGLAESSIYHGQYRTYDRWKSVQKMGQLKVDYRGKKAIPELGGRICHELVRTCEPAEADAFILGESPRSDPNQLFTTVQIFLDAETGYQVGAVLTRADGQLIGSYFFRDVLLNPSFPPGQFTPAAFGK